ncbi:hypothetical protein TCAL_00250 [Tigriopus californicus]|uniref:Uncharacterized protein n=1 Tax=Tigriopus californicus TaxID=6832 RepID=A0A553P1Z0_TIGCA|nr:hypothetical protein TCAL_00250 [Tigriopus californicus]
MCGRRKFLFAFQISTQLPLVPNKILATQGRMRFRVIAVFFTFTLLASGYVSLAKNTTSMDFTKENLEVSRKLGLEMQKLLNQIRNQLHVNQKSLRKSIIKSNRRSVGSAFGYITAILMLVKVKYYDQTFVDLPTVLDVAGIVTEDAGYDAEELHAVEFVDTRCIHELEPLIRFYGIQKQFEDLEFEQIQYPQHRLEAHKQILWRDLTEFRRHAQSKDLSQD